MADKMFKIFVALNVLCQFCPCRTSMDIHGQNFIQTDSELRYVVDSGSAFPLTPGHGLHELSLSSSLVRFEPPLLDFGDQPVGMSHLEQVMVQNLDTQTSLHLLSISGSTSHFHCSFFIDKLVPPLSNTTFDVVFLARQVGAIENTLYIHSSKGSFKYQVMGVGIHNPYRIRPFLGAKVPVNSSFSPVINMYNPHGTVLQVEEIYSSGGDLHLELLTGEREGSREHWEIPPFETKPIMKASFIGRIENNHTGFIRIRTNKEDQKQLLIVPVEVEVTSVPGIFSLLEMLDFGLLRTMDDPVVLRLNVINSGSKPIQIVNVTLQPPNPAIHIDFRPIQVKPDIFHPTSIASISFTASEVLSLKQCSGKIVVKSKNSQHKLTVPYQATVLHGSLVYDRNQTLFYTGASRTGLLVNTTHNVAITNTFNVTVVVYNITLPPSSRHLFTIMNFTWPCVLHPRQTMSVFNLTFNPNATMLHFNTDVYLHTNTSVFKIPLSVYHGRLKVIHHRPEIYKGQLDFGTLAMGERRTMNFTLRNENPVDIVISKFSANMGGAVVRLLGVERGNATTLSRVYDSSTFSIDPLILKPFHIAVFSVELTAPDMEGAFAAEVIFSTQFEHLYIPITMRTAEGSLNVIPDKLVLKTCFPSRLSSLELRVHSTFAHTLETRGVTFNPNDTRFYYVPIKEQPVLLANQETLVGHIYFDPRRECRDDCYVSLPTHIPAGHTWLLGSTLDHEVTDTDQYLYARFRQKWDVLGTSQLSTVNVTVQVDTNKVRGFLFPAQAQFFWPTLTRHTKVKFPLTQIGNISLSEFTIENPTDVPVVVQIVPLSIYPNAQTLLDTIVPSLLPADIMSDLIVGASDDDTDTDAFTLPELSDPIPSSISGDTSSLAALRKAAENTLGMRPHRRTIALLMQARTNLPIRVNFQPRDDLLRTTLIIVRNNLTIIDTVVLQGQGGYGDLKFSNRKPGSLKPLMFEMTEKHLKSCDKHAYGSSRSIPPSFTVKRTFTMRNSGQLPIYVHTMSLGSVECEGYGFKVIDCKAFELAPNDSRKVDIIFAPDFTMSRIRQTLMIQTSLGPVPLNFTLQATIPPHMLSLCASTLPRPSWEPLLYYAAVLSMGFLLFCVIVAAYFEADRISVAEVLRRRAELNHSSAAYDSRRVFDLRAISRGLCHSQMSEIDQTNARVAMSSGSYSLSTSSTGLAARPRLSSVESVSNGHVPVGKLPVSDAQKSEHLLHRLLSRLRNGNVHPAFRTDSDATVKDAKQIGASLNALPAAGRGHTAVSRTLSWLGSVPFSAVCHVVHKLRSFVGGHSSSMGPRTAKSVKDSGPVEASSALSCDGCSGQLGSSSAASTSGGVISNRNTDQDPPPALPSKSESKGTQVRRDKSASRPTSSTSGIPTAASNDEVHSKPASLGGGKQTKLRKPKATDLRRLKEKLLEEKAVDKDDSSSTTTETSSIEADEKSSSPRDLTEVNSKSKKSSGKNKQDPVKLSGVEAVNDQTLDEFIPATSRAKGHKKKADNSALKNSSTLELPYMIKQQRSSDSTAPKDAAPRPKQSPPPTSSGTGGSSSGSQRKKASLTKSKSSDCSTTRVEAGNREPNDRDSMWDMPLVGGSRHVVDLSDLAAQTDVFARSHRSSSGRDAGSPGLTSSASSPSPLSLPNRASSYSSIVSGAKSPDHSPATMSTAPRHMTAAVVTSPGNPDIPVIGRLSPVTNSVAALSGKPLVSNRPIAAVGAVRRSWTGNYPATGASISVPDELLGSGSSVQCRQQSPLLGPSCGAAAAPQPLLIADGSDGMIYNGVMPNGCYMQPMHDDPMVPGYMGMNPNAMYPMMTPDGMMDQCGYGVVPETFMQKLQAERRRRIFEYQQRKFYENAAENGWPGFDSSVPEVIDPIWEREPSPTLWNGNLQLGTGQPGASKLTRPSSSANLWNSTTSTSASSWNAGPMYGIWGADNGTTGGANEMAVDDGSNGASIFDPFNSLELNRSIWNPNNTSGSSGVSGWASGTSSSN